MRKSVLVGSFLLFMVLLFISSFVFMKEGDPSTPPGPDLSYLQPSAFPGLLEALRNQDPSSRKKAATNLWQMGVAAKDATPTLLQVAKDPEFQVREAAVKALGRTGEGTQDAIPVLIEALQDDHAEVRAAAATSLVETWNAARNGVAGVERATGGRGGEGRRNANQGPPLVRLPPSYVTLAQKAVPPLTQALRDTDARVRAQAAAALAETGPIAEPAVAELSSILQKDSDGDVRLQATLALGNIGPGAKAATPTLVKRLRNEKAFGIRVNTASTLGLITSDAELVVPALAEAQLTDPEAEVRTWCIFGLQQYGVQARLAIPSVKELAKDPKNQQLPKFNERAERLLEMLERLGKEPGAIPAAKASGNRQSPR